MKNLNFFLTMLLFVVFITTKIEAQEPIVNSPFTGVEAKVSATSENGDYTIISGDSISSSWGKSRILDRDRNVLQTYHIEEGLDGGFGDVKCMAIAIADNGTSYNLFQNDWVDDNANFVIEKNLLAGGNIPIFEFRNAAPQIAKVSSQIFYFTIQAGYDFIPLSSGLPLLSDFEYMLVAVDINTDEILWTSIGTDAITNIQSKPNGNIAVSKNVDGASQFVEIDSSNGDEVQIIATGTDGNYDRCFISAEGKAEMYHADENTLYLHDGEIASSSNITYKTDLPDYVFNLFQDKPQSWKKIGSIYRFVSGSYYYYLDDKLTHGSRNKLDLTGYGIIKKSWVNPDGSYTFVTYNEDNTTTYILDLVVEDLSFDSILFDVDSDPNMIAAHDGHMWNGSAWIESLNQTTVMVGTLPIVGSTVNPNWIPTPNGLTLFGFHPIEALTRNEVTEIVARGMYKETAHPNHLINYQVIFKVDGSLSVANNTLIDVSVYPNPSHGLVYINYSQGVDEVVFTSTLGQILKRVSFKNNFSDTTEIDISELDSGYYFITVVKEGYAPLTKQIIKQ